MKLKENCGYDGDHEARIAKLESALGDVLTSNTLIEAKELAADVLDIEVDEYLMDDFESAGDFFNEEESPNVDDLGVIW